MSTNKPQPPEAESPNTLLARQIADRLIAEDLVPATKHRRLFEGFENGNIKAEDWRRFAEGILGEKDGRAPR